MKSDRVLFASLVCAVASMATPELLKFDVAEVSAENLTKEGTIQADILANPESGPQIDSRNPKSDGQISSVRDLRQVSTKASALLAQASTNPVQITGVKVNPTADGLEVILETSTGNLVAPVAKTSGKLVYFDIPNAKLSLSSGDRFVLENPAKGIVSVSVSQANASYVRAIVTGVSAVPKATVSFSNPTSPVAQKPDEGEEEVQVTGKVEAPPAYVVPNASTATRTNTAIIDTPQSIQVVPQQVLKDQQIVRVDQALRNVSGVTGELGKFASSQSLTIRGFTTDSFSNGPILRDGFRSYYNLGAQETANLEQIEVLKGPASVLYGQNGPGGIINLVTKQPLSKPFYDLQFQVGSFGLIRPSIDFSGPLDTNGNLLYRLNMAYQRSDGFRDFSTTSERFFIAPVVKWKISDRTSLAFSLEYLNDRSPYDVGLLAYGKGVVNVPRDRIFGERDDTNNSKSLSIGYNFEHQFDDNWTLRNAFRYTNQSQQLLTTLPAAFNEVSGTLIRVYGKREFEVNDYSLQTNVVGKFDTGSLKHTLLAGVDLNWSKFKDVLTKIDFSKLLPLNVYSPTYGLFSRPNFDNISQIASGYTDADISRTGVFLQDQIALSDQFSVIAGIRFDGVNNTNPSNGKSRYDNAWSPRLGLLYKPTESVSLFANYSQSFSPNTGQDVNGNFLEPEKAQGYEFGVKAELSKKLFATLSYFDITKQNVATSASPLSLYYVATGKQRSQGIELDISGEIAPNWNITGFYAYTNARVTEDNDIPVGNRLPGSPYNSFGLWTTYQIPDGDLQGLGFGLGVNYVGNRVGDLANSYEVGDYFLTNAAIFYKRDRWRFGLNFNNIFDVNYISGVGGTGRTLGIAPGAPFSMTASIGLQF
ncbi:MULTISPECIES: TonB-dependent receptor [Pseudanabaena]|uniref:TonB-dependent siderophore receptor n=2 Tax=Pseudanabaena TaxID=1152 RepID=L8MZ85_9CYAN|nr:MULTISPECIES: TonB-dependent receptor [Pseudanabaena]ELS31790.1 TonB-dependent siderophore receptor [Pseudanabaena biceps PCC 7429]MDG3495958.1 TonB-dependent receptor [Pseudanabaena catenata USMAC16]